MLPFEVGSNHLGQWPTWNTACDARQDRCGASAAPDGPKVRHILETRWKAQGTPEEGWIWSAPIQSGHVESSSLKKQHQKALRLSGVRPFVLYSLRHTFLTHLEESGCDVWTLARIAGHSTIGVSSRYVHPSENAVLDAFSRLSGHNFGHTPLLAQ